MDAIVMGNKQLQVDNICFNNSIAHNRAETIFLCIVLLELFLMGSGRLLEFGPLTLRMYLFCLCVFLVCYNLITGKICISEFSVLWVISYLFLLSLATLIGYLHLVHNNLIFEDIKPLLYFLMLFYFEMMVRDISRIRLISTLIKFTSVFMAIFYIIVICLLYSRSIEFKYLYDLLSRSSEFMFRGEFTLFYKGFLYLNIGLIFYIFSSGKRAYLSIILISISIFLTFTKGFIVAIIPVILIGLYLKLNNKFALIPLTLTLIIVTLFFFNKHMEIIGDKAESDKVRLVTAKQVSNEITIKSFFVGHGFGQGVPESPVHMETSLVEIFHKQGILGLSFWLALLCSIIHYYRKTILYHNQNIALPFLLSSLFIYIQSLTNPFINNPIGMSFLLISLISLRTLSTPVNRLHHA